jgi:hypothetical protein
MMLAQSDAGNRRRAQQVVVIVNGGLITALDIEQRSSSRSCPRTRSRRARRSSTS